MLTATLLAALVALIGAAGALGAWRIGLPRRLLGYSVSVASVPLLRSGDPDLDAVGVKVAYHGKKIHNPYLVTLNIESRGRRDITSADFDQDMPLVFDLNVSIVTLADISRPIESLPSTITVRDSRVSRSPRVRIEAVRGSKLPPITQPGRAALLGS